MLSRPLPESRQSEAVADSRGQRPRWPRWGIRVAVTYVALVVVVQALVLAGVLAARVAGDDPRSPMDDVPNFRVVDDRLWAGGQPEADAYRVLAERGVRLIVDLRTGAADDPRKDDPKLLESLGVA